MPLSENLQHFLSDSGSEFYTVVIIERDDIKQLDSWKNTLSPAHYGWHNVYRALREKSPTLLIIENKAYMNYRNTYDHKDCVYVPSALFDAIRESTLTHLMIGLCSENDPALHRMIRESALEKLAICFYERTKLSPLPINLFNAFLTSSLKNLELMHDPGYFIDSDIERITQVIESNKQKVDTSKIDNLHEYLLEKEKEIKVAPNNSIPERFLERLRVLDTVNNLSCFLSRQMFDGENKIIEFIWGVSTKYSNHSENGEVLFILFALLLEIMPGAKRFEYQLKWDWQNDGQYYHRCYNFHPKFMNNNKPILFEIIKRKSQSGIWSRFQHDFTEEQTFYYLAGERSSHKRIPPIKRLLDLFSSTWQTAMHKDSLFMTLVKTFKENIALYFFYEELEKLYGYFGYFSGIFSIGRYAIREKKMSYGSVLPLKLDEKINRHASTLSPTDMAELQFLLEKFRELRACSPEMLREKAQQELRAIQKEIQKKKAEKTVGLSSEQLICLGKILQEREQKNAMLMEQDEILSHPLFAPYYETFKSHFNAIVLAAITLDAGYFDMNQGLIARKCQLTEDVVACVAPRAQAFLGALTSIVGFIENRKRTAELAALKDSVCVNGIIEIESLCEKIARLLVRAYHNGKIPTPLNTVDIEILVKEQCEKLLTFMMTPIN